MFHFEKSLYVYGKNWGVHTTYTVFWKWPGAVWVKYISEPHHISWHSSSFIEMNQISMTNDFCTTLTSVFFANDQLIKLIGLFFDFVKEIDSNNYFEVKKSWF